MLRRIGIVVKMDLDAGESIPGQPCQPLKMFGAVRLGRKEERVLVRAAVGIAMSPGKLWQPSRPFVDARAFLRMRYAAPAGLEVIGHAEKHVHRSRGRLEPAHVGVGEIRSEPQMQSLRTQWGQLRCNIRCKAWNQRDHRGNVNARPDARRGRAFRRVHVSIHSAMRPGRG